MLQMFCTQVVEGVSLPNEQAKKIKQVLGEDKQEIYLQHENPKIVLVHNL